MKIIKTLEEVIKVLDKLKNEHGGDIKTCLCDPDTGDNLYFVEIYYHNGMVIFDSSYNASIW